MGKKAGGTPTWKEELRFAVEGAVTGTASGSKNLDGEADHWSSGAAISKEESEGVRLSAAERQEMNGDTAH